MKTIIKYDKYPLIEINDSHKASKLLAPNFKRKDHEEVWVLYLDNSNHPLVKKLLNIGTLTMSLIDTRRIIKDALNYNAAKVILSHNHPSCSILPGKNDIESTDNLRNACQLFDISLVDHLIFGDRDYYSYSENNRYLIAD